MAALIASVLSVRSVIAMSGHEVKQGNPVVPRGLNTSQAALWTDTGLLQPIEQLFEACRRCWQI